MIKIMIIAGILLSEIAAAQTPVNPIISKYGTVFEVPFAVANTGSKSTYKILVDIVSLNGSPCWEINESIDNIARIINLHSLAGVSKEKIKLAVIIHGPAIMTILNNEAYKQKFGVSNPNLPIFTALKEAGVELFVCGQTLFKRKVDLKDIAPEILPTISAITTITNYSAKGYTLLKY
ncbi:MAG: hypothetical protein EAZ13_01160 [Sphingobacteriia bacterium]|jgi:intracellular sulfur oxidation DsrE/DsrF family protein|nr:MAG: hypothetical protein EAZ41_09715 [Sphingobacteriia bacterium]TAG32089.1 MAG: hypothetical protein EAZ35_00510 [Sphingobacteriia bacterium]TAH09380.1 MAG: hypothetical protein EAZ13_01160 [Sphingobacteriia bacterium]